MNPIFYCPTCDHAPENDRYRDRENGCPRCPLIETFVKIRVTNTSKLIERQGGFPEGWDINSLIGVHSVVSNILSENQDRINDNWSVTFAELCRIIQQEWAQAKREIQYHALQKMKTVSKK
jgi:hypothetical protein